MKLLHLTIGVDYISSRWINGVYHVIFCRKNVNDQGPERWTDLYSILAAGGRHVSKVEGEGHCLLGALEEAFWRDYDIPYPTIIQDVAHELVKNTKYTR